MRFTLTKSILTAGLQSVLQVVPTKSTLPILMNILIEALENKLKFSATDLDVSVTTTIDCKVAKRGSVAIPGRILFDIIKELPESDVTVEATNNRVEIRIPNGSYKIASVSPDFRKPPPLS